jgi:hypothetical protein
MRARLIAFASIAALTPAACGGSQAPERPTDLVFGFNHEEAVRSFKRSAELDPKSPMPYWGIAWALGPNYNLDVDDDRAKQGNAAIAQALVLSKGGAAAERAHVEAMAIRFATDP